MKRPNTQVTRNLAVLIIENRTDDQVIVDEGHRQGHEEEVAGRDHETGGENDPEIAAARGITRSYISLSDTIRSFAHVFCY